MCKTHTGTLIDSLYLPKNLDKQKLLLHKYKLTFLSSYREFVCHICSIIYIILYYYIYIYIFIATLDIYN
jgi:hypothetical protein